jgi:thiol-disulfide isomerase/thioredoxin
MNMKPIYTAGLLLTLQGLSTNLNATEETNYCFESKETFTNKSDSTGNPVFSNNNKRGVCSLIGEKAPPLLQKDGNPHSSTYNQYVGPQQFLGNVVVLNYWASWCGPCKAELPAFEEVQQELDDIVILAWNIENNGWSSSFSEHNLSGLTFPLLQMKGKNPFTYTVSQVGNFLEGKVSGYSGDHMRSFVYGESRYIPTTFIIDKNQVVQEVHSGSLSTDRLKRIVEKYR